MVKKPVNQYSTRLGCPIFTTKLHQPFFLDVLFPSDDRCSLKSSNGAARNARHPRPSKFQTRRRYRTTSTHATTAPVSISKALALELMLLDMNPPEWSRVGRSLLANQPSFLLPRTNHYRPAKPSNHYEVVPTHRGGYVQNMQHLWQRSDLPRSAEREPPARSDSSQAALVPTSYVRTSTRPAAQQVWALITSQDYHARQGGERFYWSRGRRSAF
jgi:hypothetical protein